MPALQLQSPFTRARPQQRLAAPRAARRSLVVRAELNNSPHKAFANVASHIDGFLKRYDVVSTGMGAMIVTGYCVYGRGQDPWTALQITFSATVFALVLNELMFNNTNCNNKL